MRTGWRPVAALDSSLKSKYWTDRHQIVGQLLQMTDDSGRSLAYEPTGIPPTWQVTSCQHELSDRCSGLQLCGEKRNVAVAKRHADGDPIRSDASDYIGRSKDSLGGSKVAELAQHDVNKRTIAIDRAILIYIYIYRRWPMQPDGVLINSALASTTKILYQCWCQLGHPSPHGHLPWGRRPPHLQGLSIIES